MDVGRVYLSLPDLLPMQRWKCPSLLVAPDLSWACPVCFLSSETHLPLPGLLHLLRSEAGHLDYWNFASSLDKAARVVWRHADITVSPVPLSKREVSEMPMALRIKPRPPRLVCKAVGDWRSLCVPHSAYALVHLEISGHLSPGATPGWRRSSRGRDRQLKGELAQDRWRISIPSLVLGMYTPPQPHPVPIMGALFQGIAFRGPGVAETIRTVSITEPH